MESRLKLRVSRMFRSSFGSCRSRNKSDVIPTSNPVFSVSNNRDFHQIEPLLSPKIRTFPSICKSRLEESMGLSSNEVLHRKKVYSVSVKTESSVSSLKKKKKSKKFKRSHLKIKKKKKHSGLV
ncbi:hypothetical protein GIB67_041201 [Kingdonia uniflora]|uniref:Uncharacterized protein n=1 Tax=Kingdonia uniflora TaxID=39325 RepID=A0A7J7P784_9MAGN|nr:hypothetical protein GIB67_041201 [Kingdonia uniflora]